MSTLEGQNESIKVTLRQMSSNSDILVSNNLTKKNNFHKLENKTKFVVTYRLLANFD